VSSNTYVHKSEVIGVECSIEGEELISINHGLQLSSTIKS